MSPRVASLVLIAAAGSGALAYLGVTRWRRGLCWLRSRGGLERRIRLATRTGQALLDAERAGHPVWLHGEEYEQPGWRTDA